MTGPGRGAEAELLHWGREEEFEEPTMLFALKFEGDLEYWVSALDPLDAAKVLRDEDPEGAPFCEYDGVEVSRVRLPEANALLFYPYDPLVASWPARSGPHDPAPLPGQAGQGRGVPHLWANPRGRYLPRTSQGRRARPCPPDLVSGMGVDLPGRPDPRILCEAVSPGRKAMADRQPQAPQEERTSLP